MRHYTNNDIQQIANSIGLSPEEHAILYLLVDSPPLKSSDLIARLNIGSRQQLLRLMKKMLNNSLITKTGQGPSVKYQVNEVSMAQFFMALDYLHRSICRYDSKRLSDYKPNRNNLLEQDIQQEMRMLSNATIQKGETLNDRIFKRMIIDFSWTSSKLEGNTYTIGETEELIQKSIRSDKRTPYETLMIENHANAAKYIVTYSKDIKITPVEIRGLHAMLSNGLLSNQHGCGSIRSNIIEIGQSAYHPENNPSVLQTQLEGICKKAVSIHNPFEQSLFLMLHISYLQPFIDINKRTGRVSANIPLLKNNLCPVSFYGIDEKMYINGILEFYETGKTHTISRAFLDSYKTAVQRYRTALSQVLNFEVDVLSSKIVQIFINKVISNNTRLSQPRQFITEQLKQDHYSLSSEIREEIVQTVLQIIRNLDETKAIGAGIPLEHFKKYTEIMKL